MKHFGMVFLGLVWLHLSVMPAAAQQSGPHAFATQHAIDELANAVAQGKITLTPTPTATPTPTSTWTPSPTATSTPTLEPTAADTPEPTATDVPCWLTDEDLGDPANGYIVFDPETGDPEPCPTDVVADDESTETPQPTAAPSSTPTAPPARAAAPAPSAPAPQVVVVVQTVVVEATAVPTDTPISAPTSRSTPAPTSTRIATSSPTATVTVTATVTAIVTATPAATAHQVAAVAPTDGPVQSVSNVTQDAPRGWDWTPTIVILAVLGVGAAVIWWVTRRRLATW